MDNTKIKREDHPVQFLDGQKHSFKDRQIEKEESIDLDRLFVVLLKYKIIHKENLFKL